MAGGTKRKHQAHQQFARHAMMHNDRAFTPARGITNAATVAVSLQNRFPQTAKLFLVLPLQRVAG